MKEKKVQNKKIDEEKKDSKKIKKVHKTEEKSLNVEKKHVKDKHYDEKKTKLNKTEPESNKKNSKIKNIANKVKEKINKFGRDPRPLIIILILIIVALLVYISNNIGIDTMKMASISENGITVRNIHYFINNDMRYFYATTASYTGDDKDTEVYSYQMGYYYEDESGELQEFISRSDSFDTPQKLSEIVKERSYYSFAEPYSSKKIFTNEAVKNLDKLYFVIKASTKENSSSADIVYKAKAEITQITK